MPRTRFVSLLVVAVAALTACSRTAPEAARPPGAPAAPTPGPAIAAFSGEVDPATGAVTLRSDASRDGRTSAILPEGTAAETVSIRSIGQAVLEPDGCGPGRTAARIAIEVRSRYRRASLQQTYAELTRVSPAGREACNAAPPAPGLSADLGLWSYGTLGTAGSATDAVVVDWRFALPDQGRFAFAGRVVATPTEAFPFNGTVGAIAFDGAQRLVFVAQWGWEASVVSSWAPDGSAVGNDLFTAAWPLAFALDPIDAAIWIAFDGEVLRYDTGLAAQQARFATGSPAPALAFDDLNHLLWVTQRDAGTVTAVDAWGTPRRVVSLGSAARPVAAAFDRARGRVWVATRDGHAAAIDAGTGALLGSYPVDGDAPVTSDRAIAVDGAGVWIATYDADTVTRLDADGNVTGRYAVGRGPRALLSAAGRLWVTHDGEATVAGLDAGGQLVASLPTAQPTGALTFDGRSLLVADAVEVPNGSVTSLGVTSATPGASIYGYVAGVRAGATVTLTGPVNATTTTSGGGWYQFSDLPDGQYVITPSLPGWSLFTPASRTVTVRGLDVTGQSFSGLAAVTVYPTSLTWPAALMADQVGSVWVTDWVDDSITRVARFRTSDGAFVEEFQREDMPPTALAYDPAAQVVWAGGDAMLSRVDVAAGTMTVSPHLCCGGILPTGDPDTLWFSSDGLQLVRFSDGAVLQTVPAPGGQLARDAAGMIWLLSWNALSRFDEATGAVDTFTLPEGWTGAYPPRLALGAGQVWVTSAPTLGTIRRVDGSDGHLLAQDSVGCDASDVAFDGQRFWITCPDDNTVLSVDPDGTIFSSYRVADAPSLVAFDGADVWVATAPMWDGRLVRIAIGAAR